MYLALEDGKYDQERDNSNILHQTVSIEEKLQS